MRRALDLTKVHVRTREVFGQPLGAMQHVRFELAEMHTSLQAAQAYLDHAITLYLERKLTAESAAGLKQWTTDRQCEAIDRCLQLHGGYGYMNEYEIAACGATPGCRASTAELMRSCTRSSVARWT